MKNIHVLPTDKPSRVFITKDEGLGYKTSLVAQMLDKIEPKQETLSGFENGTNAQSNWLEQNGNQIKQETLEEVAENESEYLADWEDKEMYQKGFIEGAKWQIDRSYSEEEVLELLLNCPGPYLTDEEIKEWFKQFKKK